MEGDWICFIFSGLSHCCASAWLREICWHLHLFSFSQGMYRRHGNRSIEASISNHRLPPRRWSWGEFLLGDLSRLVCLVLNSFCTVPNFSHTSDSRTELWWIITMNVRLARRGEKNFVVRSFYNCSPDTEKLVLIHSSLLKLKVLIRQDW